MPEAALRLETRARWQVPNEPRLEAHEFHLKAAIELVTTIRPEAQLRSISNTYNCVGMVVASRRTWVDPEHLMKCLTDDDYKQLNSDSEALPGDLVVYRSDGRITHVGVVYGKNMYQGEVPFDPLKVVSKWGAGGEYVHDMNAVPDYLGTPAEFWTHRRVP